MAPRVWITRTLPEAEKTAVLVKSLGCEALIQPVLEVRRLKPEWPLTMPDALILTSHHALEALVAEGPFEWLRHVPLFVVGESLKAKVTELGFTGSITAASESRNLVPLIGDRMPPGAQILYLAPQDPATPLAEWLSEKGFRVEVCAVYETLPIRLDLEAILNGQSLFVLLHSPRAGFHLGQQLNPETNQTAREFALDVLTFICISEATRKGLLAGLDLPARSGVGCLIAERPDEASLIACLTQSLKRP